MRRDVGEDQHGYVSLRRTLQAKEGVSPAEAAKEVFGLAYHEFSYLFYPGEYGGEFKLPVGPDEQATPKQVAKHIRRFVKYKFGK